MRGHHGRGGDLHQHHVVEPHPVEAVLQRDAALDLVRLDHAREHVAHGERRLARGRGVAREPVGGQRMPPRLSEGWPHSAASQVSLKSSQRIIAPMLNAACTGSSWNGVPGTFAPCGTIVPGTIGPSSLVQAGILQRLEAAAQRVHQAVARGLVGLPRGDLVFAGVVDDVDQDAVGIGADVADVGGHGALSLPAGRDAPVTCVWQSERTRGSRGRCSWRAGG